MNQICWDYWEVSPCTQLFIGLAMTSATCPALAAVATVKSLRSSGSAWLASNTIYSCMIEPSPHVASTLPGHWGNRWREVPRCMMVNQQDGGLGGRKKLGWRATMIVKSVQLAFVLELWSSQADHTYNGLSLVFKYYFKLLSMFDSGCHSYSLRKTLCLWCHWTPHVKQFEHLN